MIMNLGRTRVLMMLNSILKVASRGATISGHLYGLLGYYRDNSGSMAILFTVTLSDSSSSRLLSPYFFPYTEGQNIWNARDARSLDETACNLNNNEI